MIFPGLILVLIGVLCFADTIDASRVHHLLDAAIIVPGTIGLLFFAGAIACFYMEHRETMRH